MSSVNAAPIVPAFNDDEVDPATVVDLRERGLVTPVKNQLHAPICAILAFLATVEGAHASKTGNLLDLSHQVVIDGDVPDAFDGTSNSGFYSIDRYLSLFPFLTTVENYPVNPLLEREPFDRSKFLKPTPTPSIVGVTNFHFVEDFTEEAIMDCINRGQPVSVSVYAGQEFESYRMGIYRGPDFPVGGDLNHIIAVVGYGRTRGGHGFWICKNSWGEQWGLNGYIYVGHGGGPNGYAGILREPRIPVFHRISDDLRKSAETWSTGPPSMEPELMATIKDAASLE